MIYPWLLVKYVLTSSSTTQCALYCKITVALDSGRTVRTRHSSNPAYGPRLFHWPFCAAWKLKPSWICLACFTASLWRPVLACFTASLWWPVFSGSLNEFMISVSSDAFVCSVSSAPTSTFPDSALAKHSNCFDMCSPLKLVVFLGTVREGRLGDRVAKYVVNKIKERGHAVELFDPEELKLPILVKPLHFYKDQSQAPQRLLEMNKKIVDSDAIVVVSAEYNHSIPPALSNLLDHFAGSSFAWKPSGIVCYSPGQYGGMRAAMQLRALLGEIGCISVSNLFGIPKVHERLDESGNPIGDEKQVGFTEKSADNFLNQVEWWAKAARHQRSVPAAASK